MKLNRIEFLIKKEGIASSFLDLVLYDVQQAILAVRWPPGAQDFALYPGLKRDKTHNGVKPIKKDCMDYLAEHGWTREYGSPFTDLNVGNMDAAKVLPDGNVAVVEWETGNISSSHRALNKMALGMLKKRIAFGFLIMPLKAFYRHLTDRIGNFPEIEPYFELYRSLSIENGVLGVFEVEHDRLADDAPRIPLGTEGRALR